jgi:CelD/BcsL family acetyltransferase involved in cellulose biosynthesis
MRKLEACGTLSYHEYGETDVSEALSWVPQFEESRRRRYPGSDLPRGYVERLVSRARPDGPIHCSAITLDGDAISWHIGFYAGRTLYWYLPMFDELYQQFSPGKIHIFLAIRAAFNRGARMVDFLRGQEAYKAGWTDGDQMRMVGLERKSDAPLSIGRRHISDILNKAGYVTSFARRRFG